MNARLRHEAEVARLHQTGEALASAEFELRRAWEEFDKVALRLQAIRDRIASAAAAFVTDATLDTFRAWLGRRDRALEALTNLYQADRDLNEADADAVTLRRRLLDALAAAGITSDVAAPLDELRTAAQAVLNREETLKSQRDAAQKRRRDVQSREGRLNSAIKDDANWNTSWAAACANACLGQTGAPPTVSAVQFCQRWPISEKSWNSAACRSTASTRCRRISANSPPRWRRWRRRWAGMWKMSRRSTWRNEWSGRSETPCTALALRDSKAKDVNDLHSRRRGVIEAKRLHDARAEQMMTLFGVSTLAEVAARLADIARKADLERQVAEAVADILDTVHVASVEEAERQLASADRDSLETELSKLAAKFQDQDERSRTLFSEYSKAADQVEGVGGDDAVARIEEERRTVLLEIEDRAVHYLRLRAGIAAAEQALRFYRQRHRSAMMEQASDAFRTISGGADSGLASQPKKDGEEDLIAIAADGSSKVASDLSKGTRFQLYLALRFAGYREFTRLRPAVPFIADDILETFDNDRAEQSLRLLGKIERSGRQFI